MFQMKLQVVVVLCLCFVQMCFESVKSEMTIERENDLRKQVHAFVGDVSERFIDDAITVLDKFEGHEMATYIVTGAILEQLRDILRHENISKIDVNSIKRYKLHFHGVHSQEVSAEFMAASFDFIKTYQSIYLKRLSPEIANGMMNLLTILHPISTDEAMENAVNYLYSNETVVMKDPFRNIQEPNASECPKNMKRYSVVQDELSAMTDIKPSVLQDVAIIAEKFPCNHDDVPTFLEDFVQIIKKLQSLADIDNEPIGVCVVKKNSKDLDLKRNGRTRHGRIWRALIEREMKSVDLILSTRLMDERFRGIIDFEKAAIVETSTDEIQKSLEYVFKDVAPLVSNCSSAN